ncbi:MAG: M48 family metalloprotease, partial [bacterium]
MMAITAYFYDGKTSQRKEVQVYFEPYGQIRIAGLERDLSYSFSEIRVSPRVGNTPRSIFLPGGAKCETPDNDAIDAVLKRQGKGRGHAFVHKLESKPGYILLSLVLTVFGLWGFIEYGIPALAKRVAYSLPESADAVLGRDGLQFMDRALFSPSELEDKQQSQLVSLFNDMTQGLGDEHDFRLEFRKSERVGANAFALPSGIIVVTDDLVLLARHQNELESVLAHEIGHVIHRHTLRSMLQNSAAVLVLASITGDVTSITALSSAMPTMLLEAKYSRAFEIEADQFALDYLRWNNIPTEHFANILLRLEQENGYNSETHSYLSSHPATSDRVKMFGSGIEYYAKSMEIDSLDAAAFYFRGEAYSDSGQYEQAITNFDLAIKIDPDYDYAHNQLGWAYMKLARYDKSINAYKKSIELDSGYTNSYGN